MSDRIDAPERRWPKFVDEVFFYSGQYALFYIVMNLSASVPEFFTDVGHVTLLALVPVQAAVLAFFGGRPVVRLFGSFILPVVYSLQEIPQGVQYVLDMSHVFFWVFSVVLAVLQSLLVRSRSTRVRQSLEFTLTLLNVMTFLFLYLYFDLRNTYAAQLAAGTMSQTTYLEQLEIYHLGASLVGFVQDPTHIYIAIGGLILGGIVAVGRVRIIRLKDRISELFGRYVDRGIRDRILSGSGAIATRREITVLFSDIRGFTRLSEQHEPEEVRLMLNRYFDTWHRIASRFGGIVDKYIGDAVMILFGVDDRETPGQPSTSTGSQKSAAERAVSASFEMCDALPLIQADLAHDNLPVPGAIGIGINSGAAIVGDIGGKDRLNFTAIGDCVNVASRLEGLSKTHGAVVMISDSVYARIGASQRGEFSLIGRLPIRGKDERINVYGSRANGPTLTDSARRK